ncbi:hypothetical protein GLOTRDRAFT_93389 [Gloeophyllum trabeum ATCC 11539]|uniref:Uncharacterized protein n=1 Tax=Gloeophyllum trabeum (strain ATCC 11539 / FP-39264 / Madison 617) TaxID=670483 RepID=S7Q740_GLOTA|nr:uncharacterized protein GLOTRDRAFT_93389 [Gloeophyllum trabeum ATCC 11539]EPQ55846.1 hypothetical protein GLOTRDRAFT_93389 [Gloeophyllum trabeum ATCC 11539]
MATYFGDEEEGYMYDNKDEDEDDDRHVLPSSPSSRVDWSVDETGEVDEESEPEAEDWAKNVITGSWDDQKGRDAYPRGSNERGVGAPARKNVSSVAPKRKPTNPDVKKPNPSEKSKSEPGPASSKESKSKKDTNRK